MNFHIVTIFPEMFNSYLDESILGRAQKENKIKINIYDLRDYADKNDKRRTVDDTPYGGGPGMVMKVEPIFKCVEKIKNEIKNEDINKKILILLTSAKGEVYNQQKAEAIKNDYTDVIIICGRYEGVDERVAEFIADEEISIGRYVLTGGELPAMIIVDSVTRLLEGVLGNEESLLSESHNVESDIQGEDNFDYPVYTRPIEFNGWEVPEVLLSGNHKKIEEWRKEKK
jgi:tRNA (guanine37-N1)-methyltransferase